MTNKRNPILLTMIAVMALFSLTNCEKEPEVTTDDFDVQFVLPSLIETSLGGTYTFTVTDGKAPLATDSFMMEATSGVSYTCTITETSSTSFTVQFSTACQTGTYTVYLKRETRKKSYGTTYLSIVEEIEGLDLNDDTTVYGLVSTDDGPLEGVVVSDGIEVVTTDANGIYQIASEKERGYVFISVPSGYEVGSTGILPNIYYTFKGSKSDVERNDFKLTKKSGQDTFKIFMLGDMHLAKRTNDLNQFTSFTDDLNAYIKAHKGETMYGLTLGDMTWDLYWYSNNFSFPEYLSYINEAITDLQIFHTMGNHDNDYLALTDFSAESSYIANIAPTYYSFNIGKIHFVVLDDIDCSNYDGTTSRNYTKNFTTEQLNWLRKDLSYVDTSTPLIITTHAQICYPQSSGGFALDGASTRTTNTENFISIIQNYYAHIVTGHTHLIFNVTPQDDIVSGMNLYEHNSGSICGSWWWSAYLTSGVHIGQDGSPGGYAIWDISGTDIKYVYKATGSDTDYQFRAYDLNNVSFSLADVPDMDQSNSTLLNAWNKYVDAFPTNSNNEVLINVWNWNANWTLKVTDENGKELSVSEVWTYDPLHIAALSAKRFNSSSITSVPNFTTIQFSHLFKVTCDDADVDLTITATDEFGNVYTDKMERPMEFSTDVYKK
ncbi:MAG: calcineurin-like phosphoesterase family protein [Bacteroidales bacterium]|nr:calcineurin-like phosphoesterase family protein [Bacteroidales bacterium]